MSINIMEHSIMDRKVISISKKCKIMIQVNLR